jgi:lysozyme
VNLISNREAVDQKVMTGLVKCTGYGGKLKMTIHPVVVDLSHHNTVTDWEAVKKFGILGVILKATEDLTHVDETYEQRRAEVEKLGLLEGSYHFLRPSDGVKQADHYLSVAQPSVKSLVALDYEIAGVPGRVARAFLGRIEEKLGRLAVLYYGGAVHGQLGTDAFIASHRLWHPEYPKGIVPHHVPPPFKNYWLWQFTGDGLGPPPHQVPGIKSGKGADINTYDGTAEQLAKEWAA